MTPPFLLVQLSDPHIGATWASPDPTTRLAGAVSAVRAMPESRDAVLVSGDLADHATDAEYEEASALLAKLGTPVHVLPGNHDDRARLRRHFGTPGAGAEPIRYSADLGPMRLVVVDTTIPGRDDGALERDQLDWLDAELARAPRVPTIVAMHHPPLSTGIPPSDEAGLPASHRRALGDVLGRHAHVQTVAAGHVHRSVTSRLSGCPVVTAPSTYVQLRLGFGSNEIDLAENEPSGFLVHALVDGEIVSHLQPIV